MGVSYDNSAVERYFDGLGEKEWDRLDRPPLVRLFEVHQRFIRRWVAPEARVLEIGAGPGRFTVEPARIGCRVVVSDISSVQLELNKRHVSDAGLKNWPVPAAN